MCPISKTQKILNSILGTSFGPCAFAGVQEGTILNRGAMWLWTAFSWIHCTTCHLGLRILLGTRFGVPQKCCYACQRSANAIGVLSASNIFRSVVSRTQNLWGKDWQPWATERMCPKLSSLEWRIWWLPFFPQPEHHKSADTCRYRWDSYLIAGASCKLSQLQASNQLIHHHFLLSENHPGM